MSAVLLTAPATEPLSVADAKNFLRVEHSDDDAIIAALVASARNHVEALTRSGIITQTWRLTLDRWPDNGRVAPKLGPLRSLAAGRVYNEANISSSIDTEALIVDRAGGVTRTWTTFATVWASVAPVAARNTVEADNDGAIQNYRIVLRSNLSLTLQHRFSDGARQYRIVTIKDRDGARFLEIDAEVHIN